LSRPWSKYLAMVRWQSLFTADSNTTPHRKVTLGTAEHQARKSLQAAQAIRDGLGRMRFRLLREKAWSRQGGVEAGPEWIDGFLNSDVKYMALCTLLADMLTSGMNDNDRRDMHRRRLVKPRDTQPIMLGVDRPTSEVKSMSSHEKAVSKRWIVLGAMLAFSVTAHGQQPDELFRWATEASSFPYIHNVIYTRANGQDQKLDVILTGPRNQPRPTVLFIHGGGWINGSKDDMTMAPLPFVVKGMNIVNIDYRLAHDSLAPAAVEDCRCALRWIEQHQKEYGFDTNKIVAVGESAGGHLALTTAMLEPGAGFDNDCPAEAGDPTLKVAAVVSYSGPTDVADLLEGPNRRYFTTMWFGSLPGKAELARRLSPMSYIRPGLPPIIMTHGDKDPYVPYQQAVRLHEALDRAGDPNTLITVPGPVHGWAMERDLDVQEKVFLALKRYGIITQ
jgi:acetyl esterase/lipase